MRTKRTFSVREGLFWAMTQPVQGSSDPFPDNLYNRKFSGAWLRQAERVVVTLPTGDLIWVMPAEGAWHASCVQELLIR